MITQDFYENIKECPTVRAFYEDIKKTRSKEFDKEYVIESYSDFVYNPILNAVRGNVKSKIYTKEVDTVYEVPLEY